MSTTKQAHVGIKASSIWDKYPELEGQYRRMWRNLVKKGLSSQAHRNPNSSMLKGMGHVIVDQWPYLDSPEVAKLADMMTSNFRNNIHSPDWNQWRPMLPKLFPCIEESDIMKQFILRENEEGGAISIQEVESSEDTTLNTTACVIIIKGGSMNAQFNDVPQDIAYTVMSELAKSMA